MYQHKQLLDLRLSGLSATFVALLLLGTGAEAGGANCGNAVIDTGETCDDGNAQIGDGCSSQCLVESGFVCSAPYVPLTDNKVPDGGFEAGSPSNFWNEVSSQNPSVLCSTDTCPEEFGARQGAWWARFGSTGQPGDSRITQNVEIPTTHTYLDFDILQPLCDFGVDFLEIQIDGSVVFTADGDAARCFQQGAYEHQVVDLQTAPGGPYNDGQFHNLTIRSQTFFETNGPTLFLLDNVRIGRPDGAPSPSVCEVDHNTVRYEDFDPGVEGDLSVLGFTTIELNDSVPWGTTDDGTCGSGDIPPGNFTGGAGEAACLDVNAVGGGDILSFFCTDPLDLSDAGASQLQFLLNVQLDPAGQDDFFTVLVGNQPPDPGSIGNYVTVYETFNSVGVFSEPPGQLITADLSVLDGEPEAYVCFGLSSMSSFYAHVDNVDVSFFFCTEDDDSDKLQSCFDNCSLIENPDQTDSDGDGYGNACDGDIGRVAGPGRVPAGNGNDCITNVIDLAFLRNAFFARPTDAHWNPDADFTGDLVVNTLDLGRMKLLFFQPPGPSGYTQACTPAP